MTLFDNMLELNNSFLLIALIIIAIICIYLLYSNLTKSGETASLKSGITALIQQNKKRDEIINFLLERVENLEHNVTPAQILPVAQNPVGVTMAVDDLDDVLSSVEQTTLNTVSAEEVEDILDSINTTTENTTHATVEDNTHQGETQSTETVLSDVVHVEDTIHPTTVCTGIESPTPNVNSTATAVTPKSQSHHSSSGAPKSQSHHSSSGAMGLEFSVSGTNESSVSNTVSEDVSEFAELESEFNGLLTTSNVREHNTIESVSADLVSADLVSALLDAEEESLAGDHEFDLSTVPKSKDKLNAQYTVKQLKALSRQLKLKSKGNKTDLINRIYEKLN